MAATKKSEEQRLIKDLENPQGYYYNKEDDCYIVFIKSLAKNIVVTGETHRGIIKAYSGEDARSVEEICSTFSIPRSIFSEYRGIFSISRDSLPLSDEDILENSIENSVESLLENKKFEISQQFQKKNWALTQREAENWRALEMGQLKPFVSAIEKWKAPAIKIPVTPKLKVNDDKSLIVVLTDTHAGAFADPQTMQSGKKWDKQQYLLFFEKYKSKILELFKFHRPKEIALFILGDTLDGLRGTTEKGTKLEQELNRDGQFDLALSTMVDFVGFLSALNIPIQVRNVRGNHGGVSEYILVETVKQAFKNQKNIEFFNYHTQMGVFKMRDTMFILTHGANDVLDAKLPANGPKREAYIQTVIMNHKELFKETKNCVAMAGDLHKKEMVEYGTFDFYLIGSPAESLYADRLNLHSRPSQSCFILTDAGIEDYINVYFD